MKRLVMSVLAVMASVGSVAAGAQDWAKATLNKSPRHGEFVTITEPGGRKLQAWVVYPEVKEKVPVVVMIHEIFGLSDWAREMADEVAGAGYIVVEPDLLSGYGPGTGGTSPNAAVSEDHAHMHGAPVGGGTALIGATPGGSAAFPDVDSVRRGVAALSQAGVIDDLNAAADWGKKLPAASGKLFVAGFCWGGQQTFEFATHRKDAAAYFVFYGPPPAAEAMKNITAPVYGFYAGNDARVTSTVEKTVVDMKAAGKVYEPVTYDGAGHGFMRAGEAPDANAPNTAARSEGFRRLITLLGGVR